MSRCIILIVCTVSVGGCAAQPDLVNSSSTNIPRPALDDDAHAFRRLRKHFHLIKVGMPKAEVARLIEYPRYNIDSSVWQWQFHNTGMADEETYEITFENGMVADKHHAGKHFAHRDPQGRSDAGE